MGELNKRMKDYEKNECKNRMNPLLPTCARLDGKSFSKFTKNMIRPYDIRFLRLMDMTTKYLVEETNANIGYTQSDEISLIWYSGSYDSQIFFDGKTRKMLSVLASMATAKFNFDLGYYFPENKGMLPLFDCRVWNVPTLEEAANYIVWREMDATRNSISMATRHYYSHNEVYKKSSKQQQEMLWERGINWNDYEPRFKRGVYFQKYKTKRKLTKEELINLPEKHDARQNPDMEIERSEIKQVILPPIKSIQNKIDVLFFGVEPIIKETENET